MGDEEPVNQMRVATLEYVPICQQYLNFDSKLIKYVNHLNLNIYFHMSLNLNIFIGVEFDLQLQYG